MHGFVRSLSARRPLTERMVAAAVLVLVSLLVTYTVRVNLKRHATAVTQRSEGHHGLYQDVYRWIEQNTDADDRFVAFDDVYLYLHTGRQAMWPLAVTTEPRFRPDLGRLENQMSRIADVAEYIDADYLVWTDYDYSHAPAAKERWRLWAESWPLVMSHEDAKVKVFTLQRGRQESSGSSRSGTGGRTVAVGTSVARRPPHRSVRELQLIRLLPGMITVGLPPCDSASARPPGSVTRQTRRCVRAVQTDPRSPWSGPFPPDPPPAASRLCSDPS